jgi:hypothetical protein
MGSYKNQKPLDPDTQVWHYTSLDAVTAMLNAGQMRLRRIDAYQDPFEGSVPTKQVDDQLPIFASAAHMMQSLPAHFPDTDFDRRRYRDPWADMSFRRRAKTRSAHACCWRWGDESEAMWRLYCKDGPSGGQGLALRTPFGKLVATVAHEDVYVSPINYRFYHEGDGFNDEIDAFLHKRKGFEYEQEIRVLKYDEAQYLTLVQCLVADVPTPPKELPEYTFLDWPLKNAVDAITISPYASEDYESKARAAIAARDPALKVELSVLHERRYGPQF